MFRCSTRKPLNVVTTAQHGPVMLPYGTIPRASWPHVCVWAVWQAMLVWKEPFLDTESIGDTQPMLGSSQPSEHLGPQMCAITPSPSWTTRSCPIIIRKRL